MSGPSRLEGRYLIDEPIALGERRHVYRGRRILNGQVVALKRLASDPSAPDYQDDLELLRKEHAILASLSVPSVPRPVELFEAEGSWWLVEEFVEGSPLADELSCAGPLSAERSVEIMLAVLQVLEGLHRRGLAYGDLKLDNVVLAPDGGAWLVNFEVVSKGEMREDISAAGSVLQAMLGGKDPKAPEPLRELIRRSLHPDPEQRFQTVAEMRHALVGKGKLRGLQARDMPGGSLGPCLRVLQFPSLGSHFPWILSWLENRDRWVAIHEHGLRFEDGDALHELPWGEIDSLRVRRRLGRISRIELGVADSRVAFPGPWPGLEILADEIVRNARLVQDTRGSVRRFGSTESLYRR